MWKKQTGPTATLWPQTFLRRDPCRRELALPGTLFLLSHQGGGPTQPCHCVLRSLEVQTLRQHLPGSRRITRTISVHRACPPHWAHTRLFTLQAPGFPVAPSRYPNPSISLVMLWKLPENKKNSPKELVLGSSGLVISLPNERVERWICRPIPAPCPVPSSSSARQDRKGKKGRWKLEGCSHLCWNFLLLPQAMASLSPACQSDSSFLPQSPPINSQNFTKVNQEQGGRDFETELLVSQGARDDARGQM